MSAQTTLTIRIDPAIKSAAKRRAEQLGVSLSSVIANELRQFINGAPMVVDDNSRLPNASALAARRQARAEYDSGDYLTLATPADIAAYQPEQHE
jgi:antitoxin component of RelBE/YafQ-DinJ toxin-antitoxin module